MHHNRTRRLPRRALLGLGFAAGLSTLSGCASSPTIDGANRVPPPSVPPPPPLEGLDAGIAAESQALAWCDAIGDKGYKLPAGLSANLPLITEVHRRHLLALQLPDPSTRPSGTPSAGLDPQAGSVDLGSDDVQRATSRMIKALGDVSASHREAAVAGTGSAARFWASLAAAAAQSARIVPRTKAMPALADEPAHAAVEVPTEPEALATLLTQLHALVYGCQVALSGVSGEKASEPFVARLSSARLLRDDVTEALRALRAEVPAAEPAYEVTVPADTGAARGLVRGLESALLPHLGAAVSGVGDGRVRARLVDALTERARVLVDFGARPQWWPGYPS
ncbi:MAG: ferritin-like domain-containing protein [Propionibacteriales bacterium]|nr:ferritin-like domain-containing protein [Propionibacteriales bacterium]